MSKEKKPTVTAGRKSQYQRYKDGKRLQINQRKRAARVRKAADKLAHRIARGTVTLRGSARASRRIQQGITDGKHISAVIDRLNLRSYEVKAAA